MDTLYSAELSQGKKEKCVRKLRSERPKQEPWSAVEATYAGGKRGNLVHTRQENIKGGRREPPEIEREHPIDQDPKGMSGSTIMSREGVDRPYGTGGFKRRGSPGSVPSKRGNGKKGLKAIKKMSNN